MHEQRGEDVRHQKNLDLKGEGGEGPMAFRTYSRTGMRLRDFWSSMRWGEQLSIYRSKHQIPAIINATILLG